MPASTYTTFKSYSICPDKPFHLLRNAHSITPEYALGLNSLFYSLLHLPFQLRAAVTVLVITPVGLLMGMFFPMGLSHLREQARQFIPWAWGINGCMSVFGSFAAIVLAMKFGFGVVLWLGVLAYVCACVMAFRIAAD